jgi:transcriptional regulator with XRE-family HTH domain
MPRPPPEHSQAQLWVKVAKVLSYRRKELGVSQEQLALLDGVERGEHNRTIMTLGQLCEASRSNLAFCLKLRGTDATGPALPELNKGNSGKCGGQKASGRS